MHQQIGCHSMVYTALTGTRDRYRQPFLTGVSAGAAPSTDLKRKLDIELERDRGFLDHTLDI